MSVKPNLFAKVSCKGYLRKINDGRYIESIKNEGNTYDCTYVDTNNPELKIECEHCGDLDFLKTYYQYREKHFTGSVVGYKKVVATGYLTVETSCDFLGREYTRFGKQPKDTYECAIVFFANNRKRYVPIDNIEPQEVKA